MFSVAQCFEYPISMYSVTLDVLFQILEGLSTSQPNMSSSRNISTMRKSVVAG